MAIITEKTNAEPTTLKLQLLGSSTILEPQAACNSSSRSQMRSSFYKQKLDRKSVV